MYFSFSTIGFLAVAVAFVWFWQDSLRARDIANAAAMSACDRMGLQFLDGTAAFTRLRFAREAGRLCLRRTYVFDYTAESIDRRQGFAILLGMEVEYVGFASEHNVRPAVSAPEPPSVVNDSAEQTPGDRPGNVLDLNAHRARSARNRLN